MFNSQNADNIYFVYVCFTISLKVFFQIWFCFIHRWKLALTVTFIALFSGFRSVQSWKIFLYIWTFKIHVPHCWSQINITTIGHPHYNAYTLWTVHKIYLTREQLIIQMWLSDWKGNKLNVYVRWSFVKRCFEVFEIFVNVLVFSEYIRNNTEAVFKPPIICVSIICY